MNILQQIRDSGLRIYILDKHTRASYIGLVDKSNGQIYDDEDRAWFNGPTNRICIYTRTLSESDDFNTPLHEFGHAIDWLLGQGKFFSRTDKYNQLIKGGQSLDWYAATAIVEQFAQAVEAFYRPEREIIDSYRVHTCHELAKKDPMLYQFLNTLLDGGEVAI